MSKEAILGTLVVVVLKARNLIDNHTFYKQDPYAKLQLSGASKQTEPDLKGGQHPVWDAELRFPISKDASDKKNRILTIQCYSKERKDDQLLGEGQLDIAETLRTGEFDDWIPLQLGSAQRGDIYLEMTFFAAGPAPLARRASKFIPSERLARPAAPYANSLAPTTPPKSHANLAPPQTSPHLLPPDLLPGGGRQPRPEQQQHGRHRQSGSGTQQQQQQHLSPPSASHSHSPKRDAALPPLPANGAPEPFVPSILRPGPHRDSQPVQETRPVPLDAGLHARYPGTGPTHASPPASARHSFAGAQDVPRPHPGQYAQDYQSPIPPAPAQVRPVSSYEQPAQARPVSAYEPPAEARPAPYEQPYLPGAYPGSPPPSTAPVHQAHHQHPPPAGGYAQPDGRHQSSGPFPPAQAQAQPYAQGYPPAQQPHYAPHTPPSPVQPDSRPSNGYFPPAQAPYAPAQAYPPQYPPGGYAAPQSPVYGPGSPPPPASYPPFAAPSQYTGGYPPAPAPGAAPSFPMPMPGAQGPSYGGYPPSPPAREELPDPYLLERYKTPLPLPPGADTPRPHQHQPQPQPPAQSQPPQPHPQPQPQPQPQWQPVRESADERAAREMQQREEEEDDRRREQERIDAELARNLDMELNLGAEGGGPGAGMGRQESERWVPGGWRPS
ncbi:hypothetical protein FA95DRAFT_1524413 [Auriscalpium vulgare]|uniref:Uncharacterized protein n=1 Tax=Auriscalpium vulgare TaxID=40419 RepID=A0ACB8RGD1_9AGAM|nr:hypothetical protein FA95DRAFT_1524413 [Auriscalpium vulgare]